MGDSDPVKAIEDALRSFPAEELIVHSALLTKPRDDEQRVISAVALAVHAWIVYFRQPLSESHMAREVERMRSR